MSSTALGAENAKKIIFISNAHEKFYYENKQNGELRSFMYMQKQQYDYQLQQSVSVRRFKHDLVNHIGVLKELMNEKNGRSQRVQRYYPEYSGCV